MSPRQGSEGPEAHYACVLTPLADSDFPIAAEFIARQGEVGIHGWRSASRYGSLPFYGGRGCRNPSTATVTCGRSRRRVTERRRMTPFRCRLFTQPVGTFVAVQVVLLRALSTGFGNRGCRGRRGKRPAAEGSMVCEPRGVRVESAASGSGSPEVCHSSGDWHLRGSVSTSRIGGCPLSHRRRAMCSPKLAPEVC